jgi:hypothetical protein
MWFLHGRFGGVRALAKYRCLGPVLLPTDRAAIFAAGAEAMRAEITRALEARAAQAQKHARPVFEVAHQADAQMVRALPLPTPPKDA